MDRTAAITAILVALIGAGLLNYVRDAVRAWRARSSANTPEAREALHVATADQSLIVVARARDELAEDNALLRTALAEERASSAADRAAWALERRAMRDEIDALEAKLRGLLDEVSDLRRRHAVN